MNREILGSSTIDSSCLASRTLANFGCGVCTSPAMINLDGGYIVLLARLPFPPAWYGGRRQLVQAIRKAGVRYASARRLNFAPRSLDGFYTSHALEHLNRRDCRALLGGVRRWLKPGGVLRAVLPDLQLVARNYAERSINADQFVERTMLSFDGASARQRIMSRDYHRWTYDADSFASLLHSFGFKHITCTEVGQSHVPEFSALDRQIDERFDRARESFYIEAVAD